MLLKLNQMLMGAIVLILAMGSLAVAIELNQPERPPPIDTVAVDTVLPENIINRLISRDFIYDVSVSQDDEVTYIIYYTNISREKEFKFLSEVERFNRQYNPLDMPFYIKNNSITYECNLGIQNAIQCFPI